MLVSSCLSSHSWLLSILSQYARSRLIPNSRPTVFAANGEPFSFGSMSSPILSNSGWLLELSDPKTHSLKNFRNTSWFKPSTTGNSIYAECLVVCRVHSFGHSANSIFTECPQVKTRQNKCTRQKTYLPRAGKKTLGKQQQDTRQRVDTRQKTATCDGRQLGCRPLELYRVFLSGTRQIGSFAECFILALGKLITFFYFWP